MPPLRPSQKFPANIIFDYVPIKNSDATLAGTPEEYAASNEFSGKKIVLVSVPGAFTPSCQEYHLPPYINEIDKLKELGVDKVVVIARNDGWVMSAWGKINGVKGPDGDVLLMGDTKSEFSKNYGWDAGVGNRNGRWAMVIERDGTVSYAESEKNLNMVSVSGLDAVLESLKKGGL